LIIKPADIPRTRALDMRIFSFYFLTFYWQVGKKKETGKVSEEKSIGRVWGKYLLSQFVKILLEERRKGNLIHCYDMLEDMNTRNKLIPLLPHNNAAYPTTPAVVAAAPSFPVPPLLAFPVWIFRFLASSAKSFPLSPSVCVLIYSHHS